MAFSPSRSYRLRAAYLLLACLSSPAFAYSPPATPGVEISFDFTGATAESDANTFFHTQCDSNDFSWKGTNLVCATGDPQNPFCTVWMVYFETDVNNCQDGGGGTNPDPDPNPNPNFPDPSSDNLSPYPWLPTTFTTELKDIHTDLGVIYDALLKGARQSSYTKTSIDQLRWQNFNQFTDLINRTDGLGNALASGVSGVRSDIQYQTQWVSQSQVILAEIRDSIKAQSGGGSSSTGEYMQVLGYMADKLGQISSDTSNLNNNSASIPAINNILSNTITDLLGRIAQGGGGGGGGDLQLEMQKLEMMMDQYNELMKVNSTLSDIKGSFGGASSDNSDVVEQLLDANSNLTDIAVRMRDIEGAIGKSEQSIVDAIGKIGDGSGSDPDAITENGCETFVCSTNSPQCYIARKEWESRCKTIADELSASESVNAATNSLTDFINSEDSDIKNLDAGTVDIKQFTEHYNSSNGVNFGGSDTCPPPYVVDAKITTFTIDLSPFCDLATVIKFFLIAFASVASGLMIVKYH
jgi:hypothetical protein